MAQALCEASLSLIPSVLASNQDREGAPQTLAEIYDSVLAANQVR